MTQEQLEIWRFLNKEIAKLNTSIYAYNRLFDKINIGDDVYNPVFQLLLDALTRQIVSSLYTFFDRTNGTWSLYRMPKADRSLVESLRDEAKEILDLRNEHLAHLSKYVVHEDNFVFLSDKGLKIVNISTEKIKQFLADTAKSNSVNEAWANDWPDVKNSSDIFIESLEDGTYLLEQMDGTERYELREKTNN